MSSRNKHSILNIYTNTDAFVTQQRFSIGFLKPSQALRGFVILEQCWKKLCSVNSVFVNCFVEYWLAKVHCTHWLKIRTLLRYCRISILF